MTRKTGRRRRWLLAFPLRVAALVIGSVFGVAQNGSAASKVAPNNTAPPVISGTTAVGSTLTTTNGTFTGTAPLTYTYQWRRCDQTGASCSDISGATSQTYDLKAVDAANTLRVAVTATNADGKDTGTSVPSAVVAAAASAPATGCPTGTGTIAIANLSSPAHLALDQQTITPGIVTPASKTIQVHFRVTACGGRPVEGALVYLTAVPFSQYSIPPEGTTGADGTVVLTMTQESGFPAARHQQLLVMFVRARKDGEDINGGIAARLLVAFPVSLR